MTDETEKSGQLKSIQDFEDFLRSKKIYRQFKDNITREGSWPCIEVFLSQTWKNKLMMEPFQAFLWADTEEGFQFWSSYDKEWQKLYYKKEE